MIKGGAKFLNGRCSFPEKQHGQRKEFIIRIAFSYKESFKHSSQNVGGGAKHFGRKVFVRLISGANKVMLLVLFDFYLTH